MGEIRFVGTGEARRYPYPVCKKDQSEQTVQFQTRLLLRSSLVWIYTLYNSISIFWTHYKIVKQICSIFALLVTHGSKTVEDNTMVVSLSAG